MSGKDDTFISVMDLTFLLGNCYAIVKAIKTERTMKINEGMSANYVPVQKETKWRGMLEEN